MASCENDWTPVIAAVAVQIPVVIGVTMNWLSLRIAQIKQRAGHDVVTGKIDTLTTLTVNGFHSPPAVPIVSPAAADQPGADPAGTDGSI